MAQERPTSRDQTERVCNKDPLIIEFSIRDAVRCEVPAVPDAALNRIVRRLMTDLAAFSNGRA
jgi:hypothetical protein